MTRTKRKKQMLARLVRQQHGHEMTPDECDNELSSAFTTIRKGMAAKGWKLPDNDDELQMVVSDIVEVAELIKAKRNEHGESQKAIRRALAEGE